jgi:hypothetical protein
MKSFFLVLALFFVLPASASETSTPESAPSPVGSTIQPPKMITLKKPKVKPRVILEALLGKISGPVLLIRGKKPQDLSTEVFLKVNDQVWVRREGAARLWVNHTSIDLGHDTIVDYQGDRLILIRGSLRVRSKQNKFFPIYSYSHTLRAQEPGEFHFHLYPHKEQYEKKLAGTEISTQEYGNLTQLSKSPESFSQIVCASGSVFVNSRVGKKGSQKSVSPLYTLYGHEKVEIVGHQADLWPKKVAKGEPAALENRYGWPEGE